MAKRRRIVIRALILSAIAWGSPTLAETLFEDDFESGLAGWEISDPQAISVIDSGDAGHGRVLHLAPAGARLHALIRDSESWGAYRIEGEMLFTGDEHNYLGLIYNYRQDERRVDLGSLYIKGNGSYIRVNPRRDWNPARMLYEEYRTGLSGDDGIVIGEWQWFAAEVAGSICHLYVGDPTTPKVTFDFYETDAGQVGFKPRVVGGPVRLDNVRVTSIERLSYRGPRRPLGITYDTTDAVTGWEVLGPLTATAPEVERQGGFGATAESVEDDGRRMSWRPFATDPRGAVLSGRVTEYLGSRSVAYFRVTVEVPEGERARFELSSLDNLVFWTDGVFDGYFERRDRFAWHDFGRNPEHPRTNGYTELGPGSHQLMVRVRGGQYATGGFFARLVPEPQPATGLDCPPVSGAEELFERAEVVLVGEIHGTQESPGFVAALACQAVRAGSPVTVGFELGESEEERFSAFLGSDGGRDARAALLAGRPWQARGQAQYGATSEAMLGLLDSLRRLRRQGFPVSFALFNRTDGRGSQDRDRKMARTLGALVERAAGGRFIVLTGNVHSRLAPGTRWDSTYQPMGFLAQQADPELRIVSLDVAHSGGHAWLCTAEGCGIRALGSRVEATGDHFAIQLDDEVGRDGHHGRYAVGEIHASPPAVGGNLD
jgi:hypothetical protein